MTKHKMHRKMLLAMAVVFALPACGLPTEPVRLMITPVRADDAADQMGQADLLAAFESTIYPNGMIAFDFINGQNIETDMDVTLPGQGRAGYAQVLHISNMAELKADDEAIFSAAFCTNTVYPIFLEGDWPLFIEEDGKLFFNTQAGAGIGEAPDFAGAKVVSTSADAFEIEVAMIGPGSDVGIPFTYRMVKQNGYWVLDNFYFWQ